MHPVSLPDVQRAIRTGIIVVLQQILRINNIILCLRHVFATEEWNIDSASHLFVK